MLPKLLSMLLTKLGSTPPVGVVRVTKSNYQKVVQTLSDQDKLATSRVGRVG